jgi:hypothetical protein
VERCKFKLCRSNLSRWFGSVFNQLVASISSPAIREQTVAAALVGCSSDSGKVSEDTRELFDVGKTVFVVVLDVVLDR